MAESVDSERVSVMPPFYPVGLLCATAASAGTACGGAPTMIRRSAS